MQWQNPKLIYNFKDCHKIGRDVNFVKLEHKPNAAAKLLQSCPTLCDPIDGSPPGSPIPGVLQARTLEWVAISFSNAWKWKVKVKLLSRVRLYRPLDCSLPGSSIHGIFQARVLEWVAIAFSDILLLKAISFCPNIQGESKYLIESIILFFFKTLMQITIIWVTN